MRASFYYWMGFWVWDGVGRRDCGIGPGNGLIQSFT